MNFWYFSQTTKDPILYQEENNMSNYTPNEQDKRRAEQIRRQYIARDANKVEQLKEIDKKVKTPGRVTSIIIGVIGAIIMGAGMSMIMVWEQMVSGLILSIPGIIAALLAYPVYEFITKSRKEKYADEIIRLSDELINK